MQDTPLTDSIQSQLTEGREYTEGVVVPQPEAPQEVIPDSSKGLSHTRGPPLSPCKEGKGVNSEKMLVEQGAELQPVTICHKVTVSSSSRHVTSQYVTRRDVKVCHET